MTLNLFGLPSAEQTVTVTRNGRTQSATSTPPAPSGLATGLSHYLRKTGNSFGGISATTAGTQNGARWGWGFAPPVQALNCVITQVDGQRFNGLGKLATPLDGFDSWKPGRYISGTADVWRAVDGVISVIRSSEVVGGNFGEWKRVISSSQIVTTTTAEFRFDGFNRPGVQYWLGVAAVASGGAYGAIATATYTPATVSAGDAASNTLTTQAVTSGGALAAPANFTATADGSGGGLVNLSWDAVSGAIGYVVFRSDTDPATHPAWPYLELASDGGPDIQVGDMVWVRNRTMIPDAATMATNRIWGASTLLALDRSHGDNRFNKNAGTSWSYADFTSEDPAPAIECGDSYAVAEVEADQASQLLLNHVWHSGAAQSFYDVLEQGATYRWTCWVRANRSAAATLLFANGGQQTQETTVNLTTGWNLVSVDYTPANAPATTTVPVGYWHFKAATTGAASLTIHFAGLKPFKVGEAYGDFYPDIAAQMVPGMDERDHNMIKDQDRQKTLAQMTSLAGCSNSGETMPGFLFACRNAGVRPWLQTPWYLTPAEWADRTAYLDAPVSSGHPMALKRAAQGQVEPWTSLYPWLRDETDNETWNTTTGFQTMLSANGYTQGETYGMVVDAHWRETIAQPWFSRRVLPHIGGRAINDYGGEAVSMFRQPMPVEVSIAAYNGGWDNGTQLVQDNDIGYQSVLADVAVVQKQRNTDLVNRLKARAAASEGRLVYGQNLFAAVYEAGPGYQLNGLNGASVTAAQVISQEVVMKSRAAATGTLEAFFAHAAAGFNITDFFTLGSGDYWKSCAPVTQGGQVYWSWQLLKIVQEQMPEADEVFDTSRLIDAGLTVTTEDSGSASIDSVWAYGLRKGSRLLIGVGNRTITTTLKPTIHTPYSGASAATAWGNIGDYREHNRYPEGQRLTDSGTYEDDELCVHENIEAQSVSVPSDLSRLVIDDALGATEDGIPPGCCVLVLLDGVF